MSSRRALGPGQARVLSALHGFDGPATTSDLHETTGLGESTLRAHLSALAEAGLVTRVSVKSGRRGRPHWAYVPRVSEDLALVRTLADALVAATAGAPAVVPEAVAAGRLWGERVTEELGELVNLADGDGERLEMALTHAGFGHEREGDHVRITYCPLLSLAKTHQSVVCAAHLGMLQGVLDRQEGVDLVPFDRPSGCLASFS